MQYDIFKKELMACRVCRERFGHEPRPIVHGSHKAPIVQISQAPSIHVHNTGLPFNDKSGKKLRHEWYEISRETFYDPHMFYITSVGKCYPGKNKSGGDKKPPKICAQLWLEKELDLLQNDLYVIIGKSASEYFFGDIPLKDLIMKDHTIRGKPAVVLPHPSPLNVKMFKDNPDFFSKRFPQIRKRVHDVLINHTKR